MITITGKVVKGDQVGRKLGFPTTNLDRREYARKKLKVKSGVWAGSAIVAADSPPLKGGVRAGYYKAAIVIGPLDTNKLPKIEAHLIGFKGNLYGQKITITLEKFIRRWKNFKNERALKNQINKDVEKIKRHAVMSKGKE